MTTLSRPRTSALTVVPARSRIEPNVDLGDAANQYIGDIPWSLAKSAFLGTSHWPEQHARQAISDYASTMAADLASLRELAGTDDLRAELEHQFAQYRMGYQIRMMAFLSSRSANVSTVILAPKTRPEPAAVKLTWFAEVKAQELENYRDRALYAIREALNPGGDRATPAKTLDDVVARLAVLEASQERMKSANVAIRAHKGDSAAQFSVLLGQGVEEDLARKLCAPDYAGRTGYSERRIKNNYSEIARLRARARVLRAAMERA